MIAVLRNLKGSMWRQLEAFGADQAVVAELASGYYRTVSCFAGEFGLEPKTLGFEDWTRIWTASSLAVVTSYSVKGFVACSSTGLS